MFATECKRLASKLLPAMEQEKETEKNENKLRLCVCVRARVCMRTVYSIAAAQQKMFHVHSYIVSFSSLMLVRARWSISRR